MRYSVIKTPIGVLTVGSTAKGLSFVSFGNHIPSDGVIDDSANRKYIVQLQEYFAGKRTQFDFPLDIQGTEFQMTVWNELRRIPYGETRSYGDIARSLGKAGAARAVGLANHHNPVAVVIPCHRVVGQNGSLTGYAGGVHLKQHLLSLERQDSTLFT